MDIGAIREYAPGKPSATGGFPFGEGVIVFNKVKCLLQQPNAKSASEERSSLVATLMQEDQL